MSLQSGNSRCRRSMCSSSRESETPVCTWRAALMPRDQLTPGVRDASSPGRRAHGTASSTTLSSCAGSAAPSDCCSSLADSSLWFPTSKIKQQSQQTKQVCFVWFVCFVCSVGFVVCFLGFVCLSWFVYFVLFHLFCFVCFVCFVCSVGFVVCFLGFVC